MIGYALMTLPSPEPLSQGILMTRRRLTAEQASTLLQRRSQNTHVKLRTIAQTVIQAGDLPVCRGD
jgi:AmiR/NasT family two-component response regulator